MNNILLDTNIIIYFLNGDKATTRLLEQHSDATFCISMVSWIEALAGSFRHKKNISEVASDLYFLLRLPMTEAVGQIAASLIQENAIKEKRHRFQDSVIAATALFHTIPLITNNHKDFRGIKGLKIITP